MTCLDFTSCIACRHPSETIMGQQALLLITSATSSSATLPKQRHPLTKAGHAKAILRADPGQLTAETQISGSTRFGQLLVQPQRQELREICVMPSCRKSRTQRQTLGENFD